MSNYQSWEWMEETGEADLILDQILEERINMIQNYNSASDTNFDLYNLFIDSIGFQMMEEAIFLLVDNKYLHTEQVIKIINKYVQNGLHIAHILDEQELNNNIVLSFIKKNQYNIADCLLTNYDFTGIKNDKNDENLTINIIVNNFKKITKNEISKKYFNKTSDDIIKLINELAFGYFKYS
tara:strand:- start:454 stop:996 length:543 start_codon:yes stop_codon:yes gene_type:complete